MTTLRIRMFIAGSVLVLSAIQPVQAWTATGAMTIARDVHTATLLPNGKVLVAGGATSGTAVTNTAELYDPSTGTWASTGSMSIGRCLHTATLLPNGKVLVVGGLSGYIFNPLTSAELYDPATGTWTTAGSMPRAHGFPVAVLLANGKVLISGGVTTGIVVTATAEIYDPATGAWASTGSMTSPRLAFSGTLLPNGKVLAAGGQNQVDTMIATAEQYNPTTGTWSSTGSMSTPRSEFSLTVLSSGKALAAGGWDNGSGPITSELYDSSTGTWVLSGSLGGPRAQHSATLLPSGNVLLAGGDSDGNTAISSVKLYNSASGIWTDLPGLNQVRSFHTATLLPNGNLLVAGGQQDSVDVSLSSSELIASVSTGGATAIGATSATLNGAVNPSGLATTAQFEYGLTTAYGSTATVALSPDNGMTAQNVGAVISGLQSETIYHYRVTAANAVGTITGADMTFETSADVPAPEIAVEQPVGTNLTDGSATVAFGSVDLGTNPDMTFTVRNLGTLDLTGLMVTKDGAAAGDFTLGALGATSLVPGASTTFTVTFAPLVAGAKTVAIHIVSNDTDENPFDINLTGTATPPPYTYTIANGQVTITGYTGSGGAVVIPGSIDGLPVTRIGDNAFYEKTNVTSVTIPASVTSIGNAAFSGCTGLTSVTIPASVINIGAGALGWCSSLTAINVDASNTAYSSVAGVLFNKIQTKLILYPGGIAGSYTLPNSTTEIGDYAFNGCTRLTGVTFSPNLTIIGSVAFYYCPNLTSVTIPASITSIMINAFGDCTSLSEINVDVSNAVYSSVDGVLFNKDRTSLIQCPSGKSGSFMIPGTVTRIEKNAFWVGYLLTNISIPNSVASIGDQAFGHCRGLTSVTIPASVTTIGSGAFYNCSGLTTAMFLGSAPSMGSNVFDSTASGFEVYYYHGASGFTSPTWLGYAAVGLPAPNIVVEQPAGTVLADGGIRDFGAVAVGSTTSRIFTIRNTGDLDLTNLAISMDGPDSGDFAVGSLDATTLAPGSGTTFEVAFTPSSAAQRTATLHIASNDPDENPFDVILEWQALPPNDAFADRINLGAVATATVSGSVELATSQVWDGEPDCSEYAMWGDEDDFTVWYEWTAPAGTKWARLELSGPSVPTVLSVYTGDSLDALTNVVLQRNGDPLTLDDYRIGKPPTPNYLSFQTTPGKTYIIRIAVWSIDYLIYKWFIEEPNLSFTLGLSSIGNPVTAGDYVFRGRAWLEKGTHSGLTNALADFNSAVELAPANEEARFLRALTRLQSLETEPAFVSLMSDLDIYRSGLFQRGGQIYLPTDTDGYLAFPSGTSTGQVFAWVDAQLLPRLAAIRADLDLITSDSFHTTLSARETGVEGVLVDKGDVLVIKAVTHGIEMFFNLLFTYNLSVSAESVMMLKETGRLDAEGVLATCSSLLQFAATDRRPQFAAALRAMDFDYRAASDFIRTKRGDPAGLLTEKFSTNPAAEAEGRDTLSLAVASLDGEVTYQGVRVNLSRLVVTNMSIRGWLPQLRGNEVVGGTMPDPTLDGILPGMTQQNVDNFVYQMGRLWGYAQYAEEYGKALESIGFSGKPDDDPDGDGNSNFLEWLRGSSPIQSNVLWQDFSRQVVTPGKAEVQISFARRKDLRDWKLVVAVSDDLTIWDHSEAQVQAVGAPVDNGDGWSETVTYRLTDAASLAERKFLRVEALPK